jgi:aryl-alcohol dehydrogenase-like predicted oxidoreductase
MWSGSLTGRERRSQTKANVDALAIAAVLAQPWVDVVLSGAAAVAHVQSNVQALTVKWDEATAVALQPLLETPQIYWQTRSQLAWN